MRWFFFAGVFFFCSVFAFAQVKDSLAVSEVKPMLQDSVKPAPVDSIKKIRVDTVTVLFPQAFSGLSEFIGAKKIRFSDYRFTSDLFGSSPTVFFRSLGFIGQPGELSLYGAGNNQLSVFEDGVLQNDRKTNTFSFLFLPSESIDSIEILPLPRGFLYGAYNNPASLQVLSKDLLSRVPYSRIRFYQGPNEEGFLDAQLNMVLSKKFILTGEGGNNYSPENYSNDQASMWWWKAKLRYMYSEKLNFTGTFAIQKYEAGLNGGVDYLSVLADSTVTNPEEILYDPFLAPVVFSDRVLKTDRRTASIQAISRLLGGEPGTVSLYYQNGKDNISQTLNDSVSLASLSEYSVYGGTLRQPMQISALRFEVLATYEQVSTLFEEQTDTLYSIDSSYSNYSCAGILSLPISGGAFLPSVYAKYSHAYNMDYLGAGFDIGMRLSEKLSLIGGISLYKTYDFLYSAYHIDMNVVTGEVKARYSTPALKLEAGVYTRLLSGRSEIYYLLSDLPDAIYGTEQNELYGITFTGSYSFDQFYTEVSVRYENRKLSNIDQYASPMLQAKAGFYYGSVLFDSALVAKAGFTFEYYSAQAAAMYDPFQKRFLYRPWVSEVPAGYQVNFMLTGEVDKAAIIYFTWENLTGSKYYLTSYYPMPARGIRFGIAWEFLN